MPYDLTSNCCDYWLGCAYADPACAGTDKHHTGQDIVAAAGAAIVASADGVVKHSQDHPATYVNGVLQRNFGGVVLIEHRLATETVVSEYGHLDPTRMVAQNTTVTRGTIIGYAGTQSQNGGYTPHLHFGIRKGAYASVNTTCGWTYAGYTSCAAEQTAWYRPQDFIAAHRCSTTTPPTTPTTGAMSCGTDTIVDCPTRANLIQSQGPLEGSRIDYAGDLDWFYFFGQQGESVYMRTYPAAGTSWPAQMAIKRWASSDKEIDAATEAAMQSGTGNEAVIRHTLTRTGRFYVKIRGAGDATGPYTFEKPDVYPADSAHETTGATLVSLPFSRLEFIHVPGDVDHHAVNVGAGQRLRVDVFNRNAATYSEGANPLQMQVAVYQSATSISSSTIGTGGNAWTETGPLIAGTYHIKIRADGAQVGYYEVQARIIP